MSEPTITLHNSSKSWAQYRITGDKLVVPKPLLFSYNKRLWRVKAGIPYKVIGLENGTLSIAVHKNFIEDEYFLEEVDY